MTKEKLFKSKAFKILLPLIAILVIIALFRSGYDFGQWLKKN
jgi:fatty acid desaturase